MKSSVMDSRTESGYSPPVLLYLWIVSLLSLWFFAFFHSGEATPEWIARAQNACFGRTENGLPEAYGWILLIFAPLSFLIALLVAMPQEIKLGLQYTFSHTRHRAFALFLLLLVPIEAFWVYGKISQGLKLSAPLQQVDTVPDLPENYPRLGKIAPDFSLIDQTGKSLSLSEYKGKLVILAFAFAHCRTVCPLIINNIKQTFSSLPSDKVQLLIISLDPWRDTTSALPEIAASWKLSQGMRVLSGEPAKVETVHQLYQMPIERDMKNGDVTHPALVYLISPEGKIEYLFNNPSARWLTQASKQLLIESSK